LLPDPLISLYTAFHPFVPACENAAFFFHFFLSHFYGAVERSFCQRMMPDKGSEELWQSVVSIFRQRWLNLVRPSLFVPELHCLPETDALRSAFCFTPAPWPFPAPCEENPHSPFVSG